jgi:hypothetical protein
LLIPLLPPSYRIFWRMVVCQQVSVVQTSSVYLHQNCRNLHFCVPCLAQFDICASWCYSGVVSHISFISLTIVPYNLLLWLVLHYPIPVVCSAVVHLFGWNKLWSWGCSLCFLQWIILSVPCAFFHTHKVCCKPLRSLVSSHLYPW